MNSGNSAAEIKELKVTIVRFVDEWQPGWVECEFEDAERRKHKVIDKVPIFTSDQLSAETTYPVPGTMPCEIRARWRDTLGRDLARISIANPLDDQSTEGLSEFVVLADQLVSAAPL